MKEELQLTLIVSSLSRKNPEQFEYIQALLQSLHLEKEELELIQGLVESTNGSISIEQVIASVNEARNEEDSIHIFHKRKREDTPNNPAPTLFFEQPLSRTTKQYFGAVVVRYENPPVSKPYSGPYYHTINFPAGVPVIHPYNPIDHMRANRAAAPFFPIVVHVPNTDDCNLPLGINNILSANGINADKLEVKFCTQSLPWEDKAPLLLRPHSWLFSNALSNTDDSKYSEQSDTLVGVISINGEFNALNKETFVTHYNKPDKSNPDNVVHSSNNALISQFIPNMDDLTTTNYRFYSLCVDLVKKQAVLTLHWLLNDDSYDFILGAMKRIPKVTLRNIINLEESRQIVFQDNIPASSLGVLLKTTAAAESAATCSSSFIPRGEASTCGTNPGLALSKRRR